jgi:hypothetical protein
VALVVDAGYATLHELQTVYGVSDLYRLVEVLAVRRYNEAVYRRADAQRRKDRRG